MNTLINKKFEKELEVLEKALKKPGYCPLEESKIFLQKRASDFLEYKKKLR